MTSAGEVTNRNTTYAPQEVTLTASYTSDGITKQGTLALSLEGRPNELNGLQILGEASTSPGVDTRYAAQASYANGDRRPVSPDWSVISGGQFASISADGILSIASLPVEMALVIRAAYSEGDVTKECTMSVSAKPSVFAGSVFEYTYVFRPGWQQVSIVLNLDAASKAALLALRPIVYDGRAYSHATDLSAGTSCWIFASEKTTVKVSGTPCGVLKTTQ